MEPINKKEAGRIFTLEDFLPASRQSPIPFNICMWTALFKAILSFSVNFNYECAVHAFSRTDNATPKLPIVQ